LDAVAPWHKALETVAVFPTTGCTLSVDCFMLWWPL